MQFYQRGQHLPEKDNTEWNHISGVAMANARPSPAQHDADLKDIAIETSNMIVDIHGM